jgi:hypothetical protein
MEINIFNGLKPEFLRKIQSSLIYKMVLYFLDCDCHAVGSMNEICDVVTGQCSCKTNVVARDCSQCHVNTYNMSGDGCVTCSCNVDGSTSLQCDDSGQCPCLEHVTGLKCTQCSLGYYGLPLKPCQGMS